VSSSSLRRVVLLLIYAAFVSMGLPDGILGAAWPQMRGELSVGLDDNWPMLVLGTCGAAVSSFTSGLALRRFGIGRVLVFTALLTGLVIWGYSLSVNFETITVLALFLGLGNGAIDAGLNHFVATNLSSRHMSWLHASWGVGVSLGTLIVSGVFATGGTWRGAYMAVGSIQLMLALAFVVNLHSLPSTTSRVHDSTSPHAPSLRATLGLGRSWTSMAAFFTYCGLECSAGLWITSVLHDGRGWSMQAAGLMTTLYWASLTMGRFVTGSLSQRVTAFSIVRVGLVGALLGTTLIAWSSFAIEPSAESNALLGFTTALGLLILGFSLSPIYPMLMHDTPRAVGSGHAVNLIGFQGGAGQVGFTIVPIVIGTLLRVHSTAWLGALLTLLAVTLITLLALRERAVATSRG
jgi:fucose permease